jgi:hypothetical protein
MCVATHYSADISLSRISSQKMKDISLGYAAFEFFLLHLFFLRENVWLLPTFLSWPLAKKWPSSSVGYTRTGKHIALRMVLVVSSCLLDYEN